MACNITLLSSRGGKGSHVSLLMWVLRMRHNGRELPVQAAAEPAAAACSASQLASCMHLPCHTSAALQSVKTELAQGQYGTEGRGRGFEREDRHMSGLESASGIHINRAGAWWTGGGGGPRASACILTATVLR